MINPANVLLCPVCGAENNHLHVTCAKCGAYLQRKIENLDLFDTAWSIIESPRTAFHWIAVSKHKNYSIFLSCVAGIGLAFTLCWLFKAGDYSDQLIAIMGAGLAMGPLLGVIFVLLSSAITWSLLEMAKEQLPFRTVFALSAYSMIPVVISAITILPIELMTFGIYLFTSAPSPYLLHPTSFVIIAILDGACGLWAILLFFIGLRTVLGAGMGKVLRIGLSSLAVFAAACIGIFFFLKKL
ncbi:MAG TPA: Yip1 family protein [Bacteroidota bacterium]|nr:Yip1 family protein [Bacteroidota bacterium]